MIFTLLMVLRTLFLVLHTLLMVLHTLLMVLHTLLMVLRTLFLVLRTLFLVLHTLFLVLRTVWLDKPIRFLKPYRFWLIDVCFLLDVVFDLFIHPVLRTPLKRGIWDVELFWLESVWFWLDVDMA